MLSSTKFTTGQPPAFQIFIEKSPAVDMKPTRGACESIDVICAVHHNAELGKIPEGKLVVVVVAVNKLEVEAVDSAFVENDTPAVVYNSSRIEPLDDNRKDINTTYNHSCHMNDNYRNRSLDNFASGNSPGPQTGRPESGYHCHTDSQNIGVGNLGANILSYHKR